MSLEGRTAACSQQKPRREKHGRDVMATPGPFVARFRTWERAVPHLKDEPRIVVRDAQLEGSPPAGQRARLIILKSGGAPAGGGGRRLEVSRDVKDARGC